MDGSVPPSPDCSDRYTYSIPFTHPPPPAPPLLVLSTRGLFFTLSPEKPKLLFRSETE